MMGYSAVQAHENGDCWPSQCEACQYEAEEAGAPLSGIYGQCAGCYAVEANLVAVTGTKDLSAIGEAADYPIGYGCEFCA